MGSQGTSTLGSSITESIHPLSLRTYNDKTYYSLPYAAKEVGVSRMTMLRWVRKIGKKTAPKHHIEIECIKDEMSGRYFVPLETILALKDRGRSLFCN